MNELPYQAEYAKSGKSGCRDCKQKIDNGALRIAVMIQSVIFDGRQAFWHHFDCFFKKHKPATFNDIANFNTLRNADQKLIKNKIESFSKAVMPDEADGGGNPVVKAEKRAADDGDKGLNDYEVDYAKSTRVICKQCNIKICKDEIRIKKIVHDTEKGSKYGGQALWHHVNCFAEKRSELMYFAGGENLPGFDNLKEEDKITVREAIKPFQLNEIPVKKLKEEPVSVQDLKDSKENEDNKEKAKLITRQNMTFQKYRKALEEVERKDILEMLKLNGQKLTGGPDERLNHLADCMTFGVPGSCPECGQGQLILDSFGYKCTGNISEWTKCSYVTQEPNRELLKLTDEFSKNYGTALKNYKPKTGVRLFLSAPKPVVVLKQEAYACVVTGPPLKQCQFFLYGNLKDTEAIKERITQLGGTVASELSDTVVAVVSTKQDVDQMSPKMKEIEKLNIVVVEDSFLDLLDPENGTIIVSLPIIKDNNIAGWGADPASRMPPEALKPKHGSSYEQTSAPVKLKIHDGAAVDPDSGVVDTAHVYKGKDGTVYAAVLTQTDIVAQKNSFYKMQVLQSDNLQDVWFFRSWGRIGTSIGGNQLEKMNNINGAIKKFKNLYKEKTENTWKMRKNFVKVPGRYYPLDVDYSKPREDTEVSLEVDSRSKLSVSVQKFVIKIFDVKYMRKTMMEFDLDTEKMPLGKITKNQINAGYKVLTELLTLVESGNPRQSEIVDATNRFYTLIPHYFGIKEAPILDNVDIIKNKTEMLSNLLEIEVAYSLMNVGYCSENIIDSYYLKLKCDITLLPKKSPEYQLILDYLNTTHGHTHKMKLEIQEVFKSAREKEDEFYKPFKNLHNRRLLWHGSRITNYVGILSQGLRIAPPEAPVTGYMFGKGIYFADRVTKSANYCHPKDNFGVLMLCEVALGTMQQCFRACNVKLGAHEHSAWGVGRTQPDPAAARATPDGVLVPLGKDVPSPHRTASVEYNEFIVYNVAQVNIKYLLGVKFNYLGTKK